MYVLLMLFSMFLFYAEMVSVILSELVKLRAFLKKLPSYSYCCRKHLILDSFVINSFPKLVSLPDRLLCIQIGNIETNANYHIFFTPIHGTLGHVSFGYFFVPYVIESGQTIIFSRNLFRFDFYHRNTSALSVSHHKRKLEVEVTSCTSSSIFTFCLFLFGKERINGC